MECPEEKHQAAEMDEAEEVLGLAFPTSRNSPPTLEPSEEPFDLPAAPVAAELSTILVPPTPLLLGGDEIDSALLHQALLERTSIPSLVGNQAGRKFLHESSIESSLGEHTVESVSWGNMDSEWKTIAVCQRHEFRGVSRAAAPNAGSPFFAGT